MIGKEEREAVLRVMDRGILSKYKGNWSEDFWGGEEIKALEKEWAKYFGVKHAIAVNSATSGLWAACNAIGLQQNFNKINEDVLYNAEIPFDYAEGCYYPDEVIVTPYSMTCSASIPLLFGAKPVFADIEEDYYCLDPKSVEERITEYTKAIIVVDLFGQPYDADAINEIAERKGEEYGHKIYVIEDAAQAPGAKYKGKFAGTLGDIGVFSLNVHKPIQCGEGGIIVTNDDELAIKLRLSINHAEAVTNDMARNRINCDEEYNTLVGMNLRMTELSAAIAREQLKKLDGIVKQLQEDSKYFNVKIRSECEHAFYRYAYKHIETNNITNLGLLKACANLGIEPNINTFNFKQHYITPLYQMPLFESLGYEQDLCPACEEVNENIMLAWHKEVL